MFAKPYWHLPWGKVRWGNKGRGDPIRELLDAIIEADSSRIILIVVDKSRDPRDTGTGREVLDVDLNKSGRSIVRSPCTQQYPSTLGDIEECILLTTNDTDHRPGSIVEQR